jgi:hypothetical protein
LVVVFVFLGCGYFIYWFCVGLSWGAPGGARAGAGAKSVMGGIDFDDRIGFDDRKWIRRQESSSHSSSR